MNAAKDIKPGMCLKTFSGDWVQVEQVTLRSGEVDVTAKGYPAILLSADEEVESYADMATAARKALGESLVRLVVDEMTPQQLDMAAGFALGLEATFRAGEPALCEAFSPSSNWEHYGRLVSGVEVVVGTHALYENDDDSELVTGHWYSAHAFFSGTRVEGRDLRLTVLGAVAKYTQQRVRRRLVV